MYRLSRTDICRTTWFSMGEIHEEDVQEVSESTMIGLWPSTEALEQRRLKRPAPLCMASRPQDRLWNETSLQPVKVEDEGERHGQSTLHRHHRRLDPAAIRGTATHGSAHVRGAQSGRSPEGM